MKIFESFKDIDRGLPISTQLVAAKLLCRLIEACIDGNGGYEPEDDGRVVLIEETDTEEMIEEVLGSSIKDALFEPGFVERGFFVTCVLENDGQGVTVMIPDGEWLGAKEREVLMEVCGEENNLVSCLVSSFGQ
jgi:hypothetical protein